MCNWTCIRWKRHSNNCQKVTKKRSITWYKFTKGLEKQWTQMIQKILNEQLSMKKKIDSPKRITVLVNNSHQTFMTLLKKPI